MKHDLQGIFDALLVGVIVLDDAGAVEFVNSEASRILGSSDQHMPGKVLTEMLGDDHPVCEILDRVRRGGRAAMHDDVEFPRRAGSPLPVDVAAAPVREPAGTDRDPGIALTLRDRTASRSLHEEVRERERQESYGHIAAGIAHEVKNPLGGIRGAAELLGLAASDERGKKTAKLIVNEVDRISGLVDELMVFARGEDLNIEKVNVHRLLDAMLHLLEHESGHEDIVIERHFDPSIPEIEADPARLQQVFLNLARNAFQAMEGSGRLVLSTGMSLDHRLLSSNGRPKPTLEIGFEDSGPGIPAQIRDRLSTPFFTTKKKGTGLGLAVARHWTRRHGGRLRLVSREGEGARIYIDLPLVASAPAKPPATAGASSPSNLQKESQ